MDLFQFFKTSLDSPIANGAAVTPSNSTDLPITTRGIYLGATGDVKCELAGAVAGTFVTFTALAGGVIHPIRVRKVYATGTTATGIVALY